MHSEVTSTSASTVATDGGSSDAPLCELCSRNPSALSCDACDMDDLCRVCDGDLHRSGKMQGHIRRVRESGELIGGNAASAAAAAQVEPSPSSAVAAAAAAAAGVHSSLLAPPNPAQPNRGSLALKPRASVNLLSRPPLAHMRASVMMGGLGAISEARGAGPGGGGEGGIGHAPPNAAADDEEEEEKDDGKTDCDFCTEHAAEVHCPDCDMNLCVAGSCDASMHSSPKTSAHVRTPLPPPSSSSNNHSASASVAPHSAAQPSPSPSPAASVGSTHEEKTADSGPAPFMKQCDDCCLQVAAWYCSTCQRFSCGDCDRSTHKSSHARHHMRSPYPPVFGRAPSVIELSDEEQEDEQQQQQQQAVKAEEKEQKQSAVAASSGADPSPPASSAPNLTLQIESPLTSPIHASPSPSIPANIASQISPALFAMSSQPRSLAPGGGGRNSRAFSVVAPGARGSTMQLPMRGVAPGGPSPGASPLNGNGGTTAATAPSPSPSPAGVAAHRPSASVPVCDICEDSKASVHCVDCAMNLCVSNQCDEQLHRPMKMRHHTRNPINAISFTQLIKQQQQQKAQASSAPAPQPALSPSPQPQTQLQSQPSALRPSPSPSPLSSHGRMASTGLSAFPPSLGRVFSPLASQAAAAAAAALSRAAVGLPAPGRNALLSPAAAASGGAALRARASSVMLQAPPLSQFKPGAGTPNGAGLLPSPSSPEVTPRTARGSRLCEICDSEPAALYCAACPMFLCVRGGCDTQLHRPEKMAHHLRTSIPRVQCSLCEAADAAIWCFTCRKHFCTQDGCDEQYHRPAKMAHHRREAISTLQQQKQSEQQQLEQQQPATIQQPLTQPSPAAARVESAVAAALPVSAMSRSARTVSRPATSAAPVLNAGSFGSNLSSSSSGIDENSSAPVLDIVVTSASSPASEPVAAAAVAAPVQRSPSPETVPAAALASASAAAPSALAPAASPVSKAEPQSTKPSSMADIVIKHVLSTAASLSAASAAAASNKSDEAAAETATKSAAPDRSPSPSSSLVPTNNGASKPLPSFFVVCDSCDVSLATIVCDTCAGDKPSGDQSEPNRFFCAECDGRVHASTSPDKAEHVRRAISKADTEPKAATTADKSTNLALAAPAPTHSSNPLLILPTVRSSRGVGAPLISLTASAVPSASPVPSPAPSPKPSARLTGAPPSSRPSFSLPTMPVSSVPSCERCSVHKAELYCDDCELSLDAACFQKLHQSNASKAHPRRVIVLQGAGQHSARGAKEREEKLLLKQESARKKGQHNKAENSVEERKEAEERKLTAHSKVEEHKQQTNDGAAIAAAAASTNASVPPRFPPRKQSHSAVPLLNFNSPKLVLSAGPLHPSALLPAEAFGLSSSSESESELESATGRTNASRRSSARVPAAHKKSHSKAPSAASVDDEFAIEPLPSDTQRTKHGKKSSRGGDKDTSGKHSSAPAIPALNLSSVSSPLVSLEADLSARVEALSQRLQDAVQLKSARIHSQRQQQQGVDSAQSKQPQLQEDTPAAMAAIRLELNEARAQLQQFQQIASQLSQQLLQQQHAVSLSQLSAGVAPVPAAALSSAPLLSPLPALPGLLRTPGGLYPSAAAPLSSLSLPFQSELAHLISHTIASTLEHQRRHTERGGGTKRTRRKDDSGRSYRRTRSPRSESSRSRSRSRSSRRYRSHSRARSPSESESDASESEHEHEHDRERDQTPSTRQWSASGSRTPSATHPLHAPRTSSRTRRPFSQHSGHSDSSSLRSSGQLAAKRSSRLAPLGSAHRAHKSLTSRSSMSDGAGSTHSSSSRSLESDDNEHKYDSQRSTRSSDAYTDESARAEEESRRRGKHTSHRTHSHAHARDKRPPLHPGAEHKTHSRRKRAAAADGSTAHASDAVVYLTSSSNPQPAPHIAPLADSDSDDDSSLESSRLLHPGAARSNPDALSTPFSRSVSSATAAIIARYRAEAIDEIQHKKKGKNSKASTPAQTQTHNDAQSILAASHSEPSLLRHAPGSASSSSLSGSSHVSSSGARRLQREQAHYATLERQLADERRMHGGGDPHAIEALHIQLHRSSERMRAAQAEHQAELEREARHAASVAEQSDGERPLAELLQHTSSMHAYDHAIAALAHGTAQEKRARSATHERRMAHSASEATLQHRPARVGSAPLHPATTAAGAVSAGVSHASKHARVPSAWLDDSTPVRSAHTLAPLSASASHSSLSHSPLRQPLLPLPLPLAQASRTASPSFASSILLSSVFLRDAAPSPLRGEEDTAASMQSMHHARSLGVGIQPLRASSAGLTSSSASRARASSTGEGRRASSATQLRAALSQARF